MVAERKRHRI